LSVYRFAKQIVEKTYGQAKKKINSVIYLRMEVAYFCEFSLSEKVFGGDGFC
jgi:hypothetical protein